ncbi:hypothetical protein PZH39_16380, partial [Desulfovibrio desulfuricans]|nr:hypothetical protein [Desulfovibrio desulfuricans]
MLDHDPRGDLAPRDVVAQAMMDEMLHTGAPCLYLDVSGVEQDVPTRFPTVYEKCRGHHGNGFLEDVDAGLAALFV